MKDRALIFLSLAISIAALGYAVWVRQHAEQMAEQALRTRERQFVQAFAPKVQDVYRGLGVTNFVSQPMTLDELFGPYIATINLMLSSSDSETNK